VNDEFLNADDIRLLDRLIDGELDDAERRALLLRLEQAPDGWRRCALAFLENQAWRGETKAWAREPAPRAHVAPAQIARRNWTGSATWMPMVVAACCLVAAGTWFVVRDRDGRAISELNAPRGAAVSVAGHPAASPADGRFADRRSVDRQNASNLRFVVGGGADRADEVVEVPLVNAEQLNEALFGQWSQAVPAEVLQMLERSGHQVVRERRLVPIELGDGRRAVVPMDQVEIRPVSRQGYQ